MSAIDLDHIAEALKCMEGETDRQNYFEGLEGVVPMQKGGYPVKIVNEKIVIFKNEEDQAGAHDAKPKISLPGFPGRLFNPDARKIVDEDRDEKYENVIGNKEHVKYATGHQQEQPPESVGQEIVQQRNKGKE
jgi:hypothetical protein